MDWVGLNWIGFDEWGVGREFGGWGEGRMWVRGLRLGEEVGDLSVSGSEGWKGGRVEGEEGSAWLVEILRASVSFVRGRWGRWGADDDGAVSRMERA